MYNYKLFKHNKDLKPKELLIKIKKLLPKHLNSIPDNAAISIFETIKKTKRKNLMLETGAGVSTIAMFLGSYIYNKKFYTFEVSSEKISTIKQIINESICENLKINISDYWIPICRNSLCDYAGIKSLKDLNKKFDFAFFDSEHNLNHLLQEIKSFTNLSSDNFFIGIDDAHMNYKKVNIDYINLIRTKAGLKKILIKNNLSKEFYLEIYNHFKLQKYKIKIIKPNIKLNTKNDDYYKYYKDLVFKPDEKKKFKLHKTAFFSIRK